MTRSVVRVFAVSFLGLAAIAGSFALRRAGDSRLMQAQRAAVADSAAAAQITRSHHDELTTTKVRFGDNFGDVLRSQQLDPQTVIQITTAAQQVFKPRTLRAGQQVDFVHRWDGALKSVLLHSGWDQAITITRMPEGFVAAESTLPSSNKVTVVQGTITSSLFESVLEVGEHPELAVRLAEIFAWDLDFYTDPRPGDTFRLVFEKRTVNGSDTPSYGRIYAAEYVNGGRPLDAVLFHDPDGKPAYYTADGKSLQKAFLRSPLKFAARVSSHFSTHRFHPVLKIYRAHLGTDYAAPVGTPVQAIANGRVEFSARKGGNGNLVILRHSNGFKSYYLHLSQRLVRVGQSVQQGQRIGLVGATGLASGPHLDFRLLRNGQFVDFERMKLPPSNPVAKKDQPTFFAERDKWIAMLRDAATPGTQVARTHGKAGSSTAD